MGHDISGYNKAGDEICYIRFGMGNYTSYEFYDFFNAIKYHGGVSGIGEIVSYTAPQIEKALVAYNKLYPNDVFISSVETEDDFFTWERKEMLKFITICLEIALLEGCVRIAFA